MTITNLQQKKKRVLRELVSKENNHEIWCLLSTLLYFCNLVFLQEDCKYFHIIQTSNIINFHIKYLLCKYDVAYYINSYFLTHFLPLSRFHRSFKIFGAKKLRIVAKCHIYAMTSLLITAHLLIPLLVTCFHWCHSFLIIILHQTLFGGKLKVISCHISKHFVVFGGFHLTFI